MKFQSHVESLCRQLTPQEYTPADRFVVSTNQHSNKKSYSERRRKPSQCQRHSTEGMNNQSFWVSLSTIFTTTTTLYAHTQRDRQKYDV